jgi:DNA-binding CsgD family transcriptional regulator
MNEPHDNVRALFETIKPLPAPELSPEKTRLLELLGDGWSEEEIARELSVPVDVVSTGVEEVVGKLRARSTLHALAIAFRRGLQPVERSKRSGEQQHRLGWNMKGRGGRQAGLAAEPIALSVAPGIVFTCIAYRL